MKRLLLILFAVFILVSPVQGEFFKDIVVTSPTGIWTDSRAYSTLAGAIAAIGASEQDLYIAKEEVCTTLTIPANIRLHFVKDGSIANSNTLTINTKNIHADHQIFTGAGAVNFIANSEVRSRWFVDFETAITQTSNDTVTLTVDAADTLLNSAAVGNNVLLKWNASNLITIAAGKTLSNIGDISAPDIRLFVVSGAIAFKTPSPLKAVYASWFGNSSATLDIADNAAVVAGKTLIISSGPWVIDANLTLSSYVKMLLGADLQIATNITCAFTGQLDIGNYQVFTLTGTGKTTFLTGASVKSAWFSSLADAITCLGTTSAQLEITKPETISTDTTIALTTKVTVQSGNILSVDTTKTLTINGPVQAGLFKWINCTGTGKVTGLKTARPEWWGAVSDDVAVDNAPYIIQAIDSTWNGAYSGEVIYAGGTYYVASEITPTLSVQYGWWHSEAKTLIRWNGATDATKSIMRFVIDADHYFYHTKVDNINFNGGGKAGFCLVIEGATLVQSGTGGNNRFKNCFLSDATVANVVIGDNDEPMVYDVDASNNMFDHCSIYDAGLYNVKLNGTDVYNTKFPGTTFGRSLTNATIKQHVRIMRGGATHLHDVEFVRLPFGTASNPNGADDDIYCVYSECGGLSIRDVYMEEDRLLKYSDGAHSWNTHVIVENVYTNNSQADEGLDNARMIQIVNGSLSMTNCQFATSGATYKRRRIVVGADSWVSCRNVKMTSGFGYYEVSSDVNHLDVDGYVWGNFNPYLKNWDLSRWIGVLGAHEVPANFKPSSAGTGTFAITRSTDNVYFGDYTAHINSTVAPNSGINGLYTFIPKQRAGKMSVIVSYVTDGTARCTISINGGTGQIGSTAQTLIGTNRYVALAQADLSAQAVGDTTIAFGVGSGAAGVGDLWIDSVVVVYDIPPLGTETALLNASPEPIPGEYFGFAAPTLNYPWRAMDKIRKWDGASGGEPGWVCTVAGSDASPGTWVEEADLK